LESDSEEPADRPPPEAGRVRRGRNRGGMQRASTARGAAGSGAVLLLVFVSVAVLPGSSGGGGRKMALGGEARGVARYSNKVQNNLRSV